MRKLLIALGVIILAQSVIVRASEIKLQAKGTISCYYSSSTAYLNLTYFNKNIIYGSKVFLKSGFGGYTWKYNDGSQYKDYFDWGFQGEKEIVAIGAFTWQASLEQAINYRSGNYFLDSIQFVIRIHQPDGSDIYDRGNLSNFGFYNAHFYLPAICPSSNGSQEYPDNNLEIKTIERN